MILWLNGPFGVGKTAVARRLHEQLSDSLLVDPEQVRPLLQPILGRRYPVQDFQDWRPWRRIVATQLCALDDMTRGPVFAPQTVVVEDYWLELMSDIAASGTEVKAVTLTASPEEHERRIHDDNVEPDAAEWRRARARDFTAALPWLRTRTTLVNTDAQTIDQVARSIAKLAGLRPEEPRE